MIEEILRKFRVSAKNASEFGPHIDAVFLRFNIESKHQRAAFLAQVLHESDSFNRLKESLYYTTTKRIMDVWPKRFQNLSEAAIYLRSPEKLANYVYGGRMGNNQDGDGWLFRGRGAIQITGRANYQAAEDVLQRPYIARPDLVCEPMDAMLTSGWFWDANKLNELEDIDKISRKVNGGSNGLKERRLLYGRLMGALK